MGPVYQMRLTLGFPSLQDGKPLVLEVVREAERRLLDDPKQDKVWRGWQVDALYYRVAQVVM